MAINYQAFGSRLVTATGDHCTDDTADAVKVIAVDAAGATAIKAEDSAHTSGDSGMVALTVRQNSAAALAGTDGDYAALETDALGRLYTNGSLLTKVSVTKALIGGAYAAKDVLSESATNAVGTAWQFSNIVNVAGGKGYIVKAQVISETTAIAPRLSLFLYTDVPTCELDDNAANTAPAHADLSSYLGRLDFPALESANLSSSGDSDAMIVPGSYQGLPLAFNCNSSYTSLWGVLVTWDGFTQGAGDDMTVVLVSEQS